MTANGNNTGQRSAKAWEILSTRVIYSAKPWVELSVQSVRLPGGRVVNDYHQVALPEYCVAYAETADGKIIVAQQYRHGVRAECVTLPAGQLEEGETPVETMQRELLEEAGYVADSWISLGSYVPHSNYGCGKAHLFSARNARKVQEPCSGDLEDSEILLLSKAELFRAISEGRIASLSMIAAVSLATNPHFQGTLA
jgi:ADP-ribose pyrophosphatase